MLVIENSSDKIMEFKADLPSIPTGCTKVESSVEYITRHDNLLLFWKHSSNKPQVYSNYSQKWCDAISETISDYLINNPCAKVIWNNVQYENTNQEWIHAEYLTAYLHGQHIEYKSGLIIAPWRDVDDSTPIGLFNDPQYSFRIKTKQIIINNIGINPPVKNPIHGKTYYLAIPIEVTMGMVYDQNNQTHRNWRDMGLIHKTKEDSEKHIAAMISFTGKMND